MPLEPTDLNRWCKQCKNENKLIFLMTMMMIMYTTLLSTETRKAKSLFTLMLCIKQTEYVKVKNIKSNY